VLSPELFQTSEVLGTRLAVLDYTRAVEIALQWAMTPAAPRTVAAANTHVVTLARWDSQFRAAIDTFDLVLPDGMPLVWVMNRSLPERLRDRVYGPTFMLRCLETSQATSIKHFFMGGTDELLDALVSRLREKFPKLQIAGTYAPPFGNWSDEENSRIREAIGSSGATMVWVGLGCPKQEQWLAAHKAELPPAVYSAVGAAFAFHAGRVRQAPPLMQRLGLEWLFRLLTEPRRLWRRYLQFNTLFVLYLARDLVRGRR
jgi:N-acetylglucosaminyldiphosphoundecaprenol N-acetyl-beta-D-mannosaminyltransferase